MLTKTSSSKLCKHFKNYKVLFSYKKIFILHEKAHSQNMSWIINQQQKKNFKKNNKQKLKLILQYGKNSATPKAYSFKYSFIRSWFLNVFLILFLLLFFLIFFLIFLYYERLSKPLFTYKSNNNNTYWKIYGEKKERMKYNEISLKICR